MAVQLVQRGQQHPKQLSAADQRQDCLWFLERQPRRNIGHQRVGRKPIAVGAGHRHGAGEGHVQRACAGLRNGPDRRRIVQTVRQCLQAVRVAAEVRRDRPDAVRADDGHLRQEHLRWCASAERDELLHRDQPRYRRLYLSRCHARERHCLEHRQAAPIRLQL
ncbi:hypothetical protein D3C72_842440 [compost metagenome]